MRLFLTIILLLCRLIANGQSDTSFYDNYYQTVQRENASIFRVCAREKADIVREDIYYIGGGLKSKTYYSGDTQKLNGSCKSYYKNGTPESESNYILGKRWGEHRKFYDNGQLWLTEQYDKDSLVGELKSFYRNGSVKREATYLNNKLVKGRMYDSFGKEIPFIPFVKMPEPSYDLTRFLGSNIRYPNKARRKNVEGRVEIHFWVDKKGYITWPSVYKSVNPLLDKEAFRVVKILPPWQPGIEDDEPAEVVFKLPILFRLED